MAEWIIRYWVEWVFGLICTIVTLYYRHRTVKAKAVRLGVEALLDDRIVQLYNHYMTQGYCDIDARRSLDKLYKAYNALDGNGTATDLIEKVKKLPTEPV